MPWSAFDPKDRPDFIEAERKQWKEHLQFEAVKVLNEEETAMVRAAVPPERILRSRFAYKDKNRPQRRINASIPVKAKARLCVGGHRDPDLGQERLAVDAPTATSKKWVGSIGDVQSAFLNGVAAPRGLYFEQPVRGLPGEASGRLIEILKRVCLG